MSGVVLVYAFAMSKFVNFDFVKAQHTSGCKNSEMNAKQEATIGQVQGANNITANGRFLVVLTPVDIGTASAAGTVEHTRRVDVG